MMNNTTQFLLFIVSQHGWKMKDIDGGVGETILLTSLSLPTGDYLLDQLSF